jgi:hypothetical protein
MRAVGFFALALALLLAAGEPDVPPGTAESTMAGGAGSADGRGSAAGNDVTRHDARRDPVLVAMAAEGDATMVVRR